ncbi:TPA: HNH endonuclease [Klebsiella michiganensis]|nr:HNH endonuclease [Klebsiella michiganensis]
MRKEPSQAVLQSKFIYIEHSGLFYEAGEKLFISGSELGCVLANGYRLISVDGQQFGSHRLAWIYKNGKIPKGNVIDHVNGNPSDDRIQNLRLATRLQNTQNRKRSKSCKSGFKGVSLEFGGNRKKPWRARIVVDKKRYTIGMFLTAEEAFEAYKEEAKKQFGEFARF